VTVPLDAHEEAQFRRIAEQLREEDPNLGRTDWRHRAREMLAGGVTGTALSRFGAVVLLLLGLAALPVALATGFYPVGAAGYLFATVATVRLADVHLRRRGERRRQAARTTSSEEPAAEGADRAPDPTRFARVALVAAGVAVIAVLAISPGGSGASPGGQAPADPPAASDIDAVPGEDRTPDPTDRTTGSAAAPHDPDPS
jgi:hypothetical protein